MNTPLKLVWKFDSCLDLNTPWIWTETWFKQASSWVKTKIWWWKCDYPAEISYIVDISLPEISCVFQMFTFVTSCCSPHISTSQQKSSTECLIWCCSGCVRILPFDRLRGLCHSTVSHLWQQVQNCCFSVVFAAIQFHTVLPVDVEHLEKRLTALFTKPAASRFTAVPLVCLV